MASRYLVLCAAAAALCRLAAATETMAQPAPFSFAKAPGRLPKNVVPLDYVVALTPDISARTVSGTETVTLDFTAPSATIQFNSLNQTLQNVLFDGRPVAAVATDDKAQLTTLTLAAPARRGRHTLRFSFVGKIETEPHGLFVQEYVKPDGAKDKLLSTQFEATDARRMFPCWDEPAFRATFDLSVTVPALWTTVGNMPVASREVHGDLATTRFQRTPKMSSYLVEFTAGDLGQISADAAGTRLSVYTVKGQEQGGATALANAQQILADYNDYFAQRFPLPKLDSLALPGGFGGAMENWGAITYNDQNLLVTPSSTIGNRQGVFSVQAHEMAHQWFGDLVTMGWWDELWLNESFASWRAAKETDQRHPEWRWWENEDGSKENAMRADARSTSHAILQHVTNELEATNAFDPSITYDKGQAVLRMLEAYLGPDTFRDGIRRYMKSRAFSNATSTDLWQALGQASGKNVAEVAASWTSQPGFPVVSVQASCDAAGNRRVAVSQRRLLLQGAGTDGATWRIPLQVRSGTGAAQPFLLRQAEDSFAAGRCDEALSLNADAIGYYRVSYDSATLATNLQKFGGMPDADRIALLDDQWALVQAGMQPLQSYLALAAAMGSHLNERAWAQITTALGQIEEDERGTPGHGAFIVYARSIVKPLADQLGWDARPQDTAGIQRLRRTVLADLGAWGDAQVIAEARVRFARFVADRSTLSPDDQGMILSIVAQNASEADFAQLHAIAKSARNETELRRYYSALMRVRVPALAQQAARIAMSDEIPRQADLLRLPLVLGLSDEHPALAWTVFTDNLEQILAPQQPFGPFIVAQYGPEVFWKSVPLDQLQTWIEAHVPATMAPNIARGMETARVKLKERTLLVDATDAFLRRQPAP